MKAIRRGADTLRLLFVHANHIMHSPGKSIWNGHKRMYTLINVDNIQSNKIYRHINCLEISDPRLSDFHPIRAASSVFSDCHCAGHLYYMIASPSVHRLQYRCEAFFRPQPR